MDGIEIKIDATITQYQVVLRGFDVLTGFRTPEPPVCVEALSENSETTVFVAKLGERAVQDMRALFIKDQPINSQKILLHLWL